ncbi:hypothetical protein SG34_017590 [Thalassomonas viridans]|uniref:Uncharacterized protein n=1 Tax=Thalassomonas viridans TaxID=137584 RepID=A0AAF0C7U7_9GAMM|nr:hypothetical protein [Thalassomonas viridans]WDE03209.1 hypothetical protein SG34_017590 [Thalassomonas viridans]
MLAQVPDRNARLKKIIAQSRDITDVNERKFIADLALKIWLSGRNIAGSLESALEQAKVIHQDYQAFIKGEN